MIFRDFSTTGDGLVAALQILRTMKNRQQPLSKLAKCWTRFPQLVTNVKVREKVPFEQLDGVLKLVGEAEDAVKAEGGRVLLRYSGTESKARLLIEGRQMAVLDHWSKQICESLRRQVGA
jgi:phosphoglucosamine mutase